MFQYNVPNVCATSRYVVDPDRTIRFHGLVGCGQVELFIDLHPTVSHNRVSVGCLQRCFGSGYEALVNEHGFVNLYVDFGELPKQSVAISCKVVIQGKDITLGKHFCCHHIKHWARGWITVCGRNVGAGKFLDFIFISVLLHCYSIWVFVAYSD